MGTSDAIVVPRPRPALGTRCGRCLCRTKEAGCACACHRHFCDCHGIRRGACETAGATPAPLRARAS